MTFELFVASSGRKGLRVALDPIQYPDDVIEIYRHVVHGLEADPKRSWTFRSILGSDEDAADHTHVVNPDVLLEFISVLNNFLVNEGESTPQVGSNR